MSRILRHCEKRKTWKLIGQATLAFSFLLPHPETRLASGRQRVAIALLVFSTVIFRAELALLLGSVGLYLVLTRRTTLQNLMVPGVVSSVVALLVSVPIDSYFWQKPLWPELWGFYYNVVQGSSSDWGVSSWHYYFTSAIPRMILNPVALVALIPLSVYSPATSRAARSLLVPSLLFVAIYSLQPHKETRFIFYVSPPLTAAAALGASTLTTRISKSSTARISTLFLILSILATAIASSAMLVLSSLNYPGGDALSYFQDTILPSDLAEPSPYRNVAIHADVLTCMTGLTLFGTNLGGLPLGTRVSGTLVDFDKTENPMSLADWRFWSGFEYVLHEAGELPPGKWNTLAVVEGLSGLEVLRPGDEDGHGARTKSQSGALVGKGKEVAFVKELVRKVTGGWWVGPRMVPRIQILKRVKQPLFNPSGHFIP